jgi:hypothetical protein
MLTHPTHDRLVALKLTGMAKALEEQRRQPDIAALGFEERLALMVDREAIERANKKGKPGSGKVGLLARSATRPAATIAPCSIIACRGCSMPWRSPAAMAATHGC